MQARQQQHRNKNKDPNRESSVYGFGQYIREKDRVDHHRRLLESCARWRELNRDGSGAADLQGCNRLLERIRCHRGQALMDADCSLDHVFFPDSGVVSVVAVYADGSVIEAATIWPGGLPGCASLLRRQDSSIRFESRQT
jgi:hypothetical protein